MSAHPAHLQLLLKALPDAFFTVEQLIGGESQEVVEAFGELFPLLQRLLIATISFFLGRCSREQ